jgi:hypothetical protein
MPFASRIPTRYLIGVPAFYFAALGVIDIAADIWHHKLTPFNFTFNALLFLPLLWRHRAVLMSFGIIALLFSGLMVFALLQALMKYRNGLPTGDLSATFIGGPLFVLLTAAAATGLLLAGRRLANSTA